MRCMDFLKKSIPDRPTSTPNMASGLLSQAYAREKGIFETPAWMRIVMREEDDPLTILNMPGTGGINVMDLANLWSCAFIAKDVGRLHADGLSRY